MKLNIAAYRFVPHLQDATIAIPFVKPSVFQLHLPGWAFVVFMSFVVAATATTSLFAPTALNVIGAVMGSASLAAPFAAYAVMTACLGVWWVVRLG